MKVLLSIKPKFAEMIFSGRKKYEYRRQVFKEDIFTVIVYASSPVKKIIGEFTIETINYNKIDELWDMTKEYSGITSEYFYSYFTNKDYGYAIKIKSFFRYPIGFDIRESFGIAPPQSFTYIK